VDLKKMEKGVALLLQGMDCSLDDPNFRGTPRRVARMFKELLTPSEASWAAFPAEQSDMIVLRGHRVIAVCPHHLQPVDITAYVAYIPGEYVVGLSKLARVVDVQLNMPTLQEDLAHAIAESLDARLKPKGVAVVLAAKHGCMTNRGVKTDGDVVTSVMKGVFLLNPTVRAELFQLIGRP
jgi:GTP cyclohydrolase I